MGVLVAVVLQVVVPLVLEVVPLFLPLVLDHIDIQLVLVDPLVLLVMVDPQSHGLCL